MKKIILYFIQEHRCKINIEKKIVCFLLVQIANERNVHTLHINNLTINLRFKSVSFIILNAIFLKVSFHFSSRRKI